MSLSLPSTDAVPLLTESERISILDLLFEPSRELHSQCLALTEKRFASYSALIDTVGQQLMKLLVAHHQQTQDLHILDSILGSHPRLGEKHVDSQQSRVEQASLKQSSDEEVERLAALNREYEQKFPGLRYVVFVNGRPRDIIMKDMQYRIANNTMDQERRLAIQAMCDIANDRVGKLQSTT